MSLLSLPAELLQTIILETRPDGFENLALACKEMYIACEPFIAHHNALRSRFTNFKYSIEISGPLNIEIRTAWDLIVSIAAEPIIAYYIQSADFSKDSTFPRRTPYPALTDHFSRAEIERFIGASPHVQRVDLNLRPFVDDIEECLRKRCYSRVAASFLLSLLPNITALTLPDKWVNDWTEDLTPRFWAGDRQCNWLIKSIVKDARKMDIVGTSASLVNLSYLGFSAWRFPDIQWLENARPFLRLPHMRKVHGFECRHTNRLHVNHEGLLGKLESVSFDRSTIKETMLRELLGKDPKARIFKYSHSNVRFGTGRLNWNVAETISTVRATMGSQLEELSISEAHATGLLEATGICMQGFKRLQKLEMGLAVVCQFLCATHDTLGIQENDAETETACDSIMCPEVPLLGRVVPASVTQLSLLADEAAPDIVIGGGFALRVLFQNFAANRRKLVSSLNLVYVDCPVHSPYQQLIADSRDVLAEAGTVLKARTPPSAFTEAQHAYADLVDGYDTETVKRVTRDFGWQVDLSGVP